MYPGYQGLKYYYEIKEGNIWKNPVGGFYSAPEMVWYYILSREKAHQGFQKRIVVRNEKNEVEKTINLSDEHVAFYREHKNRQDVLDTIEKARETYGQDYKKYAFEIKTEREINEGISHVIWINPVNALFTTPKFLWRYISRHKKEYQDLEKRIKTINLETGEEEYSVLVDEPFIKIMEGNFGFLR